MSNEKHPEGLGWKERLDDPEGWSDWKPAEKEAAWDRLHERLGNEPRRKAALWGRIGGRSWLSAVGLSGKGIRFWAAASLLIIIAGAGWMMGRTVPKDDATAVAGKPRPKDAPGKVTGRSDPDHAAAAVAVRRDPAQAGAPVRATKHDVVARRGPRSDMARRVDPVRTAGVRTALVAQPATKISVAASNGIVVDTANGLALVPVAQAATRPVSPLRVIHNNELNPSYGPRPSVAGNSSPRWLKFGLRREGGQDIYSTEGRPPSVRPHITIHLSLQN